MKKTLLYASMVSMLFAVSCKETLAPIIIDNGNASDTFYVDSVVSTPQTKRTLIEELTGVSCVNCPKGAERLKELKKKYDDQLIIISFHAGGLTAKLPESDPKQTLVTEDAPYLFAIWGPEFAKPCIVVDRLKLGSRSTYPFWVVELEDWNTAILKARETTKTPVNLETTSVYNEKDGQYDITVKVKYTETVSTPFALNIYLTEDSIVDAQKFTLPNEGDSIATHYVFDHVYRKSLTNIDNVKEILPDMPAKEANLVFVSKKVFKVDPAKNWNPKNMHVIAFITENTEDKRVIHVSETKL